METEESTELSQSSLHQPSEEVLSQIKRDKDGLTAIQRAYKRANKGKWPCSFCNSSSLNKFAKCKSCGQGIRPPHIKVPEGGEPSIDPNAPKDPPKPSFKAPIIKLLPDKPSISFDDIFGKKKPSTLPSFTITPQTEKKKFVFDDSNENSNSNTPVFSLGNNSEKPKKFEFNPASLSKPSNNNAPFGDKKANPPIFNLPNFSKKKPFRFGETPSTPKQSSGKPPLANIFTKKRPQFMNLDKSKYEFKQQPSPATLMEKVSITPYQLDPGPMTIKLRNCLEEARNSNGTDFIFACGAGGMGATGLGDIPDEEIENPENSDQEMEDDENYEDPYEAAVPRMIKMPDAVWSDLCCGALNGGCVSSGGKAYVWGTNDHGMLGVSNKKCGTAFDPIEASFPEKVCIRKVDMGGSHTVFCDSKGQVWTAGTFKSDGEVGHHFDLKTKKVVINQLSYMKLEEYSNLAVAKMRDKERTLPPIVDVTSGADHFLMLDEDGRIWEMGVTVMGQRTSKRNQKKYLIPRMAPVAGSNSNLRFKKIACGSHFNLAISKDGDLYTWGQNMWMQCGHPRPEPKNPGEALEPHEAVIAIPRKVALPNYADIVDVSAGEHFAIALDSDGRVYSWGRNASYTLGRKTATPPKHEDQNHENEALPDLPQQVKLPSIKKIAAGPAHWFALTRSGKLHVFGANMEYRTGLGTDEEHAEGATVFDKRNLRDDFEVIDMAGGSMHSFFHLRKISANVKQKRRADDEFFAPAAKLSHKKI